MTWHGTCVVCGDSVTGGTDGGTLDLPAGGEAVVCLTCLCFGEGNGMEMGTDGDAQEENYVQTFEL